MRKYLLRSRKRKIVTALGLLAIAGSVAGVAIAYYLGSGTTTAPFTAGHSPATIAVSAQVDAAALPLYPGQSAGVSVTLDNTNGTHGDLHIATVSGSVVANGSGDVPGFPGCKASWFTYTGFSPNVTVPQGSSQFYGFLSGGTLTFTESGTDQSACSDATPTLTVNAS